MTTKEFDVVVVGAGFSGLYLLHQLRGFGLTVRLLEAGADVGGTWYWNRYPGARCDSESIIYSFTFDEELYQEWTWPERYSRQPTILKYLEHVSERFDLRRDIDFNTTVEQTVFDEQTNRWTVSTGHGEQVSARFCVMATGCLSVPKMPDFEGLQDFEGAWYHTGRWPHEPVDFSGLRVGVIGTGSTAIQAIPMIAEQAEHLTVFQRTANFSVPAWNHETRPEEESAWKAGFSAMREQLKWSNSGTNQISNLQRAAEMTPAEHDQELEMRWRGGSFAMLGLFADLMSDDAANDIAIEFVHDKIRERVNDPEIAELLCPKDHPFGSKRLCVDSHYYETYNRDNVQLVDIKNASIEKLTRSGLIANGTEYEFDVIVFAIGFDAMTGPLMNIDIRGSGGKSLRDKWKVDPRTYLGLSVHGFPNMFVITGPGSPSVLTNMPVAIEQHCEWVAECIRDLHSRDIARIEATKEAEDDWVEHVSATAHETLYVKANSWYMGSNVPGKPRLFTPYVGNMKDYRMLCDDVMTENYSGFQLHSETEKVGRSPHIPASTRGGSRFDRQ